MVIPHYTPDDARPFADVSNEDLLMQYETVAADPDSIVPFELLGEMQRRGLAEQ